MLGKLVVGGIIVVAIVWFVFAIVLPLTILNSAAILAICALARPRRRSLFAVLSLAGGVYLAFDISNDWLAADFVASVVKSRTWITWMAHVNAIAMAASAVLLTRPTWTTVGPLAASPERDVATRAKIRLASCVLAVVAAGAILPLTYRVVSGSSMNRPTSNASLESTAVQGPAASPPPVPNEGPRLATPVEAGSIVTPTANAVRAGGLSNGGESPEDTSPQPSPAPRAKQAEARSERPQPPEEVSPQVSEQPTDETGLAKLDDGEATMTARCIELRDEIRDVKRRLAADERESQQLQATYHRRADAAGARREKADFEDRKADWRRRLEELRAELKGLDEKLPGCGQD